MFDYNEVFEIAYSTEISEERKDVVFTRIPIEFLGISEEEKDPQVLACVEALDSLVYSTASIELIESIIDEMFDNVSEEFINEVSAEYVRKKASDALSKRQMGEMRAEYNQTVAKNDLKDAQSNKGKHAWIGQEIANKKYDEASQNLANAKSRVDRAKKLMNYGKPTLKDKVTKAVGTVKNAASNVAGAVKSKAADVTNTVKAKASSVMNTAKAKLKSAVGKVKNWVDKATAPTKPTYKDYAAAIAKKASENEKAGKPDFYSVKPSGTKSSATNSTSTVKSQSTTPNLSNIKTTIPGASKPTNVNSAPTASKTSGAGVVSAPSYSGTVTGSTPRKNTKKATTSVATTAPAIEKKTTGKKTKAATGTKKTKKETEAQQLTLDLDKTNNTTTAKEEKQTPAGTAAPEKETSVTAKKTTRKKSQGKTIGKKSTEVETSTASVAPKKDEQPVEANKTSKKDEQPVEASKTSKKDEPPKTGAQSLVTDTDKKKSEVPKLSREDKQSLNNYNRALKIKQDQLKKYESTPGSDQSTIDETRKSIEKLQAKINKLVGTSTSSVSEAIADLAILLLKTNISEESFVNIMEVMGVHDKETALKILNRNEKKFNNALDACYKNFEEGKPVNQDALKSTEHLGRRLDKFRKIYKKRFNE